MKKIINKYKTFIKYILVAFISFIIDEVIFTICNTGFGLIVMFSTIIARVISSIINYSLNRKKVFNNSDNVLKTSIEYFLLVIIQMLVSGSLVTILNKFIPVNATFIKIPVECLIFIVNYFVQKQFIFKKK